MNATDAENYFKAVCTSCGVNVETPNELYDQSVECPKCHRTFLARPKIAEMENPKPFIPYRKMTEKEKGLPGFVYGIAITIILVAGLVWVVSKFEKDLTQIAGGTAELIALMAIIALVGLICILWILFPVFMYYGMRRHEKLLTRIAEAAEKGKL